MVKAPSNAARRRNLTETDLQDGQTVRSDAFVPISQVTGTKKKYYGHGFGTSNRFDGTSGFAYADIATTPDGGSTVNRPAGTLRLVAYQSEDLEIPKAIMDEYDLGSLREAVNDARTERPIVEQQPTGAAEDEVLAWEIKVESAHDGEALYQSGCDAKIPYSEFRRS